MIEHYSPGCYRHLRPKRDESFAGFLLRLAEANGYLGIRDFVRTQLPELKTTAFAALLRELRGNPQYLRLLGRVACGDEQALLDYSFRLQTDDMVVFQGVGLQAEAWMGERSEICPQCLESGGYAHAEWDLSATTCCAEHNCQLHGHCSQCHLPLVWTRPHLNYCHHCGGDLRRQAGMPCAPSVVETSADLGALAPFRVCVGSDVRRVVFWSDIFQLAKAFAQPQDAWLNEKTLEKNEFSTYPLSRRLRALETLAQCRGNDGTYYLSRLQPEVIEKFAVIHILGGQRYIEQEAFQYLRRCAWIPEDMCLALTGMRPRTLPGMGARFFKGKPPQLEDPLAVQTFLNIDQYTYRGLQKHGFFKSRDKDTVGFDIDEVLRAARYLREGLADLTAIQALVGFPLTWHDVQKCTFLFPWHSLHGDDQRLPMRNIKQAQTRILEIVNQLTEPTTPVQLAQLLARAARPTPAMFFILARLLNGGVGAAAWAYPYRWAEIVLEEGEAQALLQDYEKA